MIQRLLIWLASVLTNIGNTISLNLERLGASQLAGLVTGLTAACAGSLTAWAALSVKLPPSVTSAFDSPLYNQMIGILKNCVDFEFLFSLFVFWLGAIFSIAICTFIYKATFRFFKVSF